jgi:predicted dehydrogenase
MSTARNLSRPLAADALEMTLAAEAKGVKTQVGFNYLCNPMLATAREMIAAGELGEIRGYRGLHAEDYMADASWPLHLPPRPGGRRSFGRHRQSRAGDGGVPVRADLQGHGRLRDDDRQPAGRQGRHEPKVEVDDVGRAFLRFENGATGSIEGNWIATGRKMQHDFEVYGTKGALAFSQEHFNVLHYFSTSMIAKGRQGFRRIEAGPDHAPYGLFCVAAGHQIGFNDLKAIEVAGYVQAVAGKGPEPFNFRKGLRIQTLVETIQTSSREGRWLAVG